MKTKYTIHKFAEQILDFWFKNEEKWWIKDNNFDQEIIEKFENIYLDAKEGKYDDWADLPEEMLALIILLDQFPRNIYRGSAKAFDTDEEALALCKHAIKYKYDYKLTNKKYRIFLYMPLQHSEDKNVHILSLEKFATINKDILKFAQLHKNIIDRFGRFPHRNIALGRETTNEEAIFLTQPNSSF